MLLFLFSIIVVLSGRLDRHFVTSVLVSFHTMKEGLSYRFSSLSFLTMSSKDCSITCTRAPLALMFCRDLQLVH